MKKLSLILFLVLVLSISIYADGDLEVVISGVSPSPQTPINPGSSVTFTLTLSNFNQNTDLTPLGITSTNPVSGQNTITLSNPLVQNELVPPQSPKQVNVTIQIPANAKPGVYTSTFTIVETDNQVNTDSVPYAFIVASVKTVSFLLNNEVVSDPLTTKLESGEDDNELFLTIKNTGNVDLNNVQVTADFTNLQDDDGDKITVTNPVKVAKLSPDGTATLKFNFDVETGFDLVSLNGKFTIKSDDLAVPLEKNLVLSVKPLACLANAKTGDLELRVENPDNGDDFEVGDLINVDLEVENTGEEDIDAEVHAVLYNQDKNKKTDTHKVSKNVNDGDEEKLAFSLDPGEINDKDAFLLFIKTFDQDNKDDSCSVEELSLNLEVPEHKVALEDISLSPSAVECGSQVAGSVLVKNIGEEDEDVLFSVYNTQLGLSKSAPSFELEDFSNNDNEQLINFAFTVPENAKPASYPIYFKAEYSDEETIMTQQLTVTCTAQVSIPETQKTEEEKTSNEAPVTGILSSTGSTVLTEKSLFDFFNTPGFQIPTLVWVLVDVLLALLIIACLVWLFRPR